MTEIETVLILTGIIVAVPLLFLAGIAIYAGFTFIKDET